MNSPRKVMVVLLCSIFSLGIVSCQQDSETLVPSDYSQWKMTSSELLNFPIPGHGNGERLIYMNDLGISYLDRVSNLESADLGFPPGTLLVKEIFASPNPSVDDEPRMITAMYKDPDHPFQRGGWVWIIKNGPNAQESYLDEEFCFTCHNSANQAFPYGQQNLAGRFQDFVFYIPLQGGY
ncbi:MAG: cytochrome P460 family protein [Spirochaetales bacterium]|nr:cytochrome P460 family protein [Spirochaetales bacterium]